MTQSPSAKQSALSILDMFTIGIGPSSSHTVGPMKAAADFLQQLPQLNAASRLQVCCYGLLALTGQGQGQGQGHGTDKAM